MVGHQLPKLRMRVRFPSSALAHRWVTLRGFSHDHAGAVPLWFRRSVHFHPACIVTTSRRKARQILRALELHDWRAVVLPLRKGRVQLMCFGQGECPVTVSWLRAVLTGPAIA
jgi:hypothetical protein